MQRTTVCGRPTVPKQTSTQKERMNGLAMKLSGPNGVSSAGSAAAILPMTAFMPPPETEMPQIMAIVPRIMTMPCSASVSATARKPPTVV